MDRKTEENLRAMFKQFNKFMLLMWRLGLGPMLNMWPEVGGRIMVMATTGRKSGQRRLTPVNYALIDGDVYCTAGFGAKADWYCNIKSESKIEVMLQDGWWEGVAEEVDLAENLEKMRQVLIGSGIVAPLMGIRPEQLSEAELAEVTATYKLIRIRRTVARTGAGGPGDLAWVWPSATFVLAGMLLLRKQK
jgi:deazaflavin-dependent oxidoreductase (nitroreductase family)